MPHASLHSLLCPSVSSGNELGPEWDKENAIVMAESGNDGDSGSSVVALTPILLGRLAHELVPFTQ